MEKVRHFLLEKQGLLTDKPSQSILDVARRIHNIQIDTISVVARAQDLTIYNRLEDYQENKVWKLLEEQKLFENYSHALCLMPIEEYPFYNWRMTTYREGKKNRYWESWISENKKVIEFVYNSIKKDGAMSSKDFKTEEKRSTQGWWNWKKEKRALEHLFYCGKILVAYRRGFQKFYDLPERVLPENISHEPMELDEIPNYLLQTIFSAIGIGNYRELRFYITSRATKKIWDNKKEKINEFLNEQVKEGTLERVKINSIDEDHYVLSNDANKLIAQEKIETYSMKLINPFDNTVRNRFSLEKFWNFKYTIEAYVPKEKRIYGYYVLPILDNNQFIGRLEPKAYRKDKIFEIKSLYFEDWFTPDTKAFERLALGIHRFVDFHKCSQIQLNEKIPDEIRKPLSSALSI
ncbi:MAG: winged helix-turn-helix domain-containing protein [Promethearchaeota archaeon]